MASSTHGPELREYYDLGSYHRPVTTNSKDAQTWFDRGLIWSYAFNHQAAVECFEHALLKDPTCSMAHWGLAYALGPNYNKPWEAFDPEERRECVKRAHRAARQAKEAASHQSPVEQALADAIVHRYPEDGVDPDADRWNEGFANAMKSVYERFPEDLDVATVYADALMNLTPWALWDIRTGEPAPHARTLEIKAILDNCLAKTEGLQHPGLLHLYIHLMEMSATPENAMPVADRLRGLVPDSGHLNHMPTHLDILCGDYRRAVASNSDAIRADEKFLAQAGAMNFYSLYRCHDYHFKIYAAMFSGQSQIALSTVTQLERTIPEQLLRIESPPMADWLEGFLAMRVHSLIRFGKWRDILDLKLPSDQELYCVTTAMIFYAKGVAFSATGAMKDAEKMRSSFHNAVAEVKPSRTLFNNTCLDILAIAGEMLNGEIEYRLGNYKKAFEHLVKSIELDDGLPYDEPWGWMQPTRHAYAALMLEQGHVDEAAKVYQADLGLDSSLPRALQHPNNIWSLHGYHECLLKLGRNSEADIMGQQLKLAQAFADIEVKSSCFCRVTN